MQEEVKQGFDLVVTHRDRKSGAVTKENPYTLHVVSAGDGGKTRIFERPVGSGNAWDAQGKPIGRWEEGKFKKDAPHIEFTPPETSDMKLARSLNEKDSRIAQLERELSAIKAEGKKADAPRSANEKK